MPFPGATFAGVFHDHFCAVEIDFGAEKRFHIFYDAFVAGEHAVDVVLRAIPHGEIDGIAGAVGFVEDVGVGEIALGFAFHYVDFVGGEEVALDYVALGFVEFEIVGGEF